MKTDLARIVGEGTFWTTAGMWAVRLIGVAYSLVVLSQLSLYQYGLAELIISIPFLISFLALPGLDTVVIADMGVEKDRKNRQGIRDIFESYFILRTVLAILGWALIFFGAGFIAAYYNEDIKLMVQAVSFTFLTSILRSAAQILLRFELKFKLLAVQHFLEEGSKLLIVILGFWLYGADPVVVIFAYVLGEFVAICCILRSVFNATRAVFSGTSSSQTLFSAYHILAAHGKWAVFGAYINNFSQSCRLWFIKIFVGTEAVAIFSVAMGLLQQTGSLVPLHKVIAPIIPQYATKKVLLMKLVDKGIKYQTLSYIFIGGVGAVLFPLVLGYLFPEYTSAFWLYQILLIALLPSGFSAVIQSVFHAFKAQKNLFIAQVGITAVTIVLLPLLLLNFGILGAAIEVVITRSLYALERYRRVKKYLPEFRLNVKIFVSFDELDKQILDRVLTKTGLHRKNKIHIK